MVYEAEKKFGDILIRSSVSIHWTTVARYKSEIYQVCLIRPSIISLTGWLMLGTVSLTMLYYLKLLTLLNRDLILATSRYDFQAELHGTGSYSLHSS